MHHLKRWLISPLLGHAGRFNERLVLSLATNPACLLMDDELNILPTSNHVRDIRPLPRDEEGKIVLSGPAVQAAAELADLVASLADTQASSVTICEICRTVPLSVVHHKRREC